MSFGKIVKAARDKLGLSQEEAARHLEKKYNVRISASYLSMIENGSKTNLTINLLKAICDFFNLPNSSVGLLLDRPDWNVDLDKRNFDILEALENNNITITIGDEPITRNQRISILRALVNPDRQKIKRLVVPVIGTIRAGIPLLSEQNFIGEVDIPADLEGHVDFALEVRGDSMIGAGIVEGDIVICKEDHFPYPGQIVVALVNGDETTLKYLVRENGRDLLRAANPEYEDIELTNGDQIQGRVVKVFKDPPSVNVYRDYIYLRDEHLVEWNDVIEVAVAGGIQPVSVKQIVENLIAMASQLAKKKSP